MLIFSRQSLGEFDPQRLNESGIEVVVAIKSLPSALIILLVSVSGVRPKFGAEGSLTLRHLCAFARFPLCLCASMVNTLAEFARRSHF